MLSLQAHKTCLPVILKLDSSVTHRQWNEDVVNNFEALCYSLHNVHGIHVQIETLCTNPTDFEISE